MYEQDNEYTIMEDRELEKIKKILDDLKNLEMVEYIDRVRVRVYPPEEDTYAE